MKLFKLLIVNQSKNWRKTPTHRMTDNARKCQVKNPVLNGSKTR